MKRILSSTIQVFRQIKSDPMMFTACFTPFVMGTLIKFGIPFLERITDFSLQAYYPIFDLLLSIMAPVLLCFAFAMITLEEIDDKVSRYFSVTPLGKSGYLFTRLGVPAVISLSLLLSYFCFSHWKTACWNYGWFSVSRLHTGNYCFLNDYNIIN